MPTDRINRRHLRKHRRGTASETTRQVVTPPPLLRIAVARPQWRESSIREEDAVTPARRGRICCPVVDVTQDEFTPDPRPVPYCGDRERPVVSAADATLSAAYLFPRNGWANPAARKYGYT